MNEISINPLRNGNFTSSEIVALTKSGTRPMTEDELKEYKESNPKGRRTTVDVMFGEKAMTYISETNMERRLSRSLSDESNARPLTWGRLVEPHVFDLLGLEYKLCSQETIQHPTIPFWCGSPDAEKFDEGKTLAEIKCPHTLKSFCQLVDPIYRGLTGIDAMNAIRKEHTDGEKFFWQITSNAILTNAKYAELIVYMPYRKDLDKIRERASNIDSSEQQKYAWIGFAPDEELPYLNDDGYYKDLNIIRFAIPESDKQFLTERVQKAGELLQPFYTN